MPIRFHAAETQPVLGPVVMLPQEGSTSGGSKRPLNSYAVLREGRSILFDAPVSWAMDGIARLAEEGRPPAAMVLSHRDLAGSGDAFEAFAERFDAPVLMHPDDQSQEAPSRLAIPLHNPMSGRGAAILRKAGLEAIRIPGHSPGSIMLYTRDEGGILLAGDCAVGPGPEQSDRTPRLERPLGADDDPHFAEGWRDVIDRLPLAAVLPLHGEAYLRREHPDDFDAIVANIWTGDPMDPRRA